MGAAIGLIIVLLHRIAKFEILQLLEKGEAAAAADPGLRQILRARRIGGRFLDAAEGEELAQRGLLARHHDAHAGLRSEEHTSELQSLMRISYAVFCLKKKYDNRSDTAH